MRVTINYGSSQKVLHLYDVRTLGEAQVQILTKLNIPISKIYFMVHQKGIIGTDLAFSLPISFIKAPGTISTSVITLIKNEQGCKSSYKGNIPIFIDYILSTMMLSRNISNPNINFDACDLLRKYFKEIHESFEPSPSSNISDNITSLSDNVTSRSSWSDNIRSRVTNSNANSNSSSNSNSNSNSMREAVRPAAREAARDYARDTRSTSRSEALNNINTRHVEILRRAGNFLFRPLDDETDSSLSEGQDLEDQDLEDQDLEECSEYNSDENIEENESQNQIIIPLLLRRPGTNNTTSGDHEIEYNFLIDTETNTVTSLGSNLISELNSNDPYIAALHELSQGIANQVANEVAQNLDLGQLEDIPITISEEEFELVSTPIDTNDGNDDQCTICLSVLRKSPEIRKLTVCGHQFHHNCIKTQLVDFNCKCPICRADVRDSLI
jgi:hypothetical protein